jgi:Rieske Fe-S protein
MIERSAVCPHVGCVVAWKPLEGCWDCPATAPSSPLTAGWINGPATADLAEIEHHQVRPENAKDRRRARS